MTLAEAFKAAKATNQKVACKYCDRIYSEITLHSGIDTNMAISNDFFLVPNELTVTGKVKYKNGKLTIEVDKPTEYLKNFKHVTFTLKEVLKIDVNEAPAGFYK